MYLEHLLRVLGHLKRAQFPYVGGKTNGIHIWKKDR